MGWSCRRPGCHNQAAVAITFDAVNCQVWIDELSPEATQLLCEQHAERLRPPRGWLVLDRRSGQTTIVTDDAEAPVVVPPRPRRSKRRWGQLDAPKLEFLGPDVQPEPVAVEPEPVVVEAEPVAVEPEPVAVEPEPVVVEPEPVAVGWEPVPVVVEPPEPEPRVEDLEELLAPKGGLLGRAFSSTGDQRSALTDLSRAAD